jgi:drug/metabolite transporter (DMT)-like permease
MPKKFVNTDRISMSRTLKVHLALLLVTLIYGSTYSIAKGIMPDLIGASGFILVRISVAAFLFQLVHFIWVREKIQERKDYLKLLIASVFGVTMNMLFFFNGLSRTNELNASVLMLNAPIFVLIFSRIVLGHKVKKRQLLGIGIAAIGALLLIGGLNFNFSSETAIGDLMIIVNAVSFAFYLVYIKGLLQKYSVLTITKFIFSFGWMLVLPFGWPEISQVNWSDFTLWSWTSLLYVSVGTTFIAYFLNAWAVQNASPTLVGTYIYLQPVIATIVATALGKQILSLEKVIFALLICTGVYLVSKYKNQ